MSVPVFGKTRNHLLLTEAAANGWYQALAIGTVCNGCR